MASRAERRRRAQRDAIQRRLAETEAALERLYGPLAYDYVAGDRCLLVTTNEVVRVAEVRARRLLVREEVDELERWVRREDVRRIAAYSLSDIPLPDMTWPGVRRELVFASGTASQGRLRRTAHRWFALAALCAHDDCRGAPLVGAACWREAGRPRHSPAARVTVTSRHAQWPTSARFSFADMVRGEDEFVDWPGGPQRVPPGESLASTALDGGAPLLD